MKKWVYAAMLLHFPRSRAFSLMSVDYQECCAKVAALLLALACSIHGRTLGGKYLQRWTITIVDINSKSLDCNNSEVEAKRLLNVSSNMCLIWGSRLYSGTSSVLWTTEPGFDSRSRHCMSIWFPVQTCFCT